MSTTHSSCPVVRRELMQLFERVEVGGEDRMFPIAREILWVRESETKIMVRHGAAELDTISTRNDYYGFLTSIPKPAEIAGTAFRLEITPTSKLCLCFDVTISDHPYLEDTSDEGKRWNAEAGERGSRRRQYRDVPNYYNGRKWWYLSDKPDADGRYLKLEAREVVRVDNLYTTLGRTAPYDYPPELTAWIAEQRAAAGVMDEAAAGKGAA